MNHTIAAAPASRVLLIGSGRLARHLQYWNSLLTGPHELILWNRSQSLHALPELLSRVQTVWLAISDRSVIPFYEAHLAAAGIPVIHFSGALHDDRLLAAHPLMSFPQDLLPAEVYPRIHFAISGREDLAEILPGFHNPFSVMPESHKALYHALCVLAGNFPQLLWNHVAEEMKQLGLPPEALDVYIAQITANYLRLKEQALTGPLVRRDYETIEKNIHSLQPLPELQHIYQAFNREFSA